MNLSVSVRSNLRGEISVSRQLHGQHMARPGWALLAALGAIVLAFMVLSLAITVTGTARFAMAMGYPAEVGYVVGAIFDIAKDVLLVALLELLKRRAFFFFAIIGSAWLGLVTYSCLATHATVSTAIATIERSGSWKMESRSNFKAELAAVEQRLAALSQPTPPRPSKTLAETLAAEKVPPGVWQDSQECKNIHDSKYFQTACAKFLNLRRELAAAEDYEKLEGRAKELRQVLATAPVVAISDPLPDAFAATLGRVLPLDGRVGVALLLTLVIEIISCFGLAALIALREEGRGARSEGPKSRSDIGEGQVSGMIPDSPYSAVKTASDRPPKAVAPPSLKPGSMGVTAEGGTGRDKKVEPPSNVLPLPRSFREGVKAITPQVVPPRPGTGLSLVGSHIPDFVRDCLHHSPGKSQGASDVWAAYETWCAIHGHAPMSRQKLGAELTGLGFLKWKSCGLIRYRDVQLVA
jgi:hypothetical protein